MWTDQKWDRQNMANKFVLNNQQKEIFGIIENNNQNYFITGKAGTGKSYLLQYLKQNTRKNAVVVAPTGVAALNVGGQTIHSFFRIEPELVKTEEMKVSSQTKKLLIHVDMVIIDEISMVRADLIDGIDQVMRKSKDPDLPFGGAQIVMFGDPYQLPPIVSDSEINKYFSDNYGGPFFFHGKVWQEAKFAKLELNHIFRQSQAEFIDLLNTIRVGNVNHHTLTNINQRVTEKNSTSALTLATTNYKVMQINNTHLHKIDKPSFLYQASMTGKMDKKSYPAEELLILKEGAQVMMLKNDKEKRWVNGSLGKVVKLDKEKIIVRIADEDYEVAKETWKKISYYYDENEKKIKEQVISQFTQYPIRLAWAVTIHKSQGQTYDQVRIDLERGAFAEGQTYVALSRCTTIEGITLARAIEMRDIKVNPMIREFMGDYEM